MTHRLNAKASKRGMLQIGGVSSEGEEVDGGLLQVLWGSNVKAGPPFLVDTSKI
jgi:hypothetical protein